MQLILVIFIIAASVGYAGWRLWRRLHTTDCDCGCNGKCAGKCSGCPLAE